VKLVLLPADPNFRANVAELHDAVKDRKLYSPALITVKIRDGSIQTQSIRLFNDELIALSSDLIHEARFPLSDVSEVTVTWRAKSALVIVEPNKSNGTQSCAIVSLHPSHTLAQMTAMEHFEPLGFKMNSYTDLLHELRAHPDYDVVIEEM
jgi:hypothetical protein